MIVVVLVPFPGTGFGYASASARNPRGTGVTMCHRCHGQAKVKDRLEGKAGSAGAVEIGAWWLPMTDPNGAAIYGVPWIPSIYPYIYILYYIPQMLAYIPAPWIRHGLCETSGGLTKKQGCWDSKLSLLVTSRGKKISVVGWFWFSMILRFWCIRLARKKIWAWENSPIFHRRLRFSKASVPLRMTVGLWELHPKNGRYSTEESQDPFFDVRTFICSPFIFFWPNGNQRPQKRK